MYVYMEYRINVGIIETTVFASPTVLVRQQDQENGHTERVFCFISCKPDN